MAKQVPVQTNGVDDVPTQRALRALKTALDDLYKLHAQLRSEYNAYVIAHP